MQAGLVSSVDWATAHTPYTQATRTKVKGLECGSYVKVVNGEFKEATVKGKPWMCWNQADLKWRLPTPTNFK